jgi:SAM-dependent methyltransferase
METPRSEILKCKFCGNEKENELILAEEKQLGMGDKFEYFVCFNCHCIQIKKVPEDLGKYYPANYYSYQEPTFPSRLNRLNSYIKESLIQYYLGYPDLTGFLTSFVFDHPFPWLRKKEVKLDSSILDIGTGAGRKILSLQRSGFTNITGIDPFLEKDIKPDGGLKILKRDLYEIHDKFDFIMLHHSLEHMPDQEEAIRHIGTILNDNGRVLIRIPVANTFAWRKYRENWIGLDAPRHLYIHSVKSMGILTGRTDLEIEEVIFDSGTYQFTGSEKYLKKLPLSTSDDIFSKEEMKKFEKDALDLNRKKDGDQACFYLKKRAR